MEFYEKHVTGGCQCGAVRYATDMMCDNSHLCHCRMCQKAVGNLFAALVAAPKANLKWTRGTPAIFRSSVHAERGFCADCGTPLFYNGLTSDWTNLTIGSLDHPEDFPPQVQIGLEARPAWFAEAMACPEGGNTVDGDEAEWAAEIKASNNQHPDHDTDNWPV